MWVWLSELEAGLNVTLQWIIIKGRSLMIGEILHKTLEGRSLYNILI